MITIRLPRLAVRRLVQPLGSVARRRGARAFVPASLGFGVPRTIRERLHGIPGWLRLATLVLLSASLIQPSLGRTGGGPQRAIAFLIDVSASMLAEDVAPNRLQAAREIAERLLDSFPGDRFAVVTFGRQAITDCPVTADREAVRQAIRAAEYRTEEGTALGIGIAAAIRTLRTDAMTAKHIVLLSDGAENEGTLPPSQAASLAVDARMALHTVGIGSSGHNVKYPTPYGSLDVRLDLDEGSLRSLAAAGGGRYWRAADDALGSAIQDELRRTKSDRQQTKSAADPLGWTLVIVAALSMVLEALLVATTRLYV